MKGRTEKKGRGKVDGHGDSNVLWLKRSDNANTPSPQPTAPLTTSVTTVSETTLQWFLEKDGRRTMIDSDRTIDLFLLRSLPLHKDTCPLSVGLVLMTSHSSRNCISYPRVLFWTNRISRYIRFCFQHNNESFWRRFSMRGTSRTCSGRSIMIACHLH